MIYSFCQKICQRKEKTGLNGGKNQRLEEVQ
jgi:hypothetical protein